MSNNSIMKVAADELATKLLALIKKENESNPNNSFTVGVGSLKVSLPRSRGYGIMLHGSICFNGELSFSGRAPKTPFPLDEKEFQSKLSEQILSSLGERIAPNRTASLAYGGVVLVNPDLRSDFGPGFVTIQGSLSISSVS